MLYAQKIFYFSFVQVGRCCTGKQELVVMQNSCLNAYYNSHFQN
jgi:hypothetical protein